jgi:hypothetical protein
VSQDLEQRLADLERRVNSLEAVTYKRGVLSRAIRAVIDKFPGPFSARQIRQAVHEYFPQALPPKDYFQVEVHLRKLEKRGIILCLEKGYGSRATIYERAKAIPPGAGKPGNNNLNTHHSYESGIRSVIRSALDELPEAFTLADVRRYVEQRLPAAKIPQGSWSSTLYKLTQRGELEVVRQHHSHSRRTYKRGPVRVQPSGDVMRETEAAWAEFRRVMEAEKGTVLAAPSWDESGTIQDRWEEPESKDDAA